MRFLTFALFILVPAMSMANLPSQNAVRLMEIEEQLRKLNGRIELLEHQLQQQAIQSAQHSTPTPESTQKPLQTDPAAATNTVVAPVDTSPILESNLGSSPSATQAYDYAFSLINKKDYASASRAFKEFTTMFPEHRLASNAYYWLGETYYVRGLYEEAAIEFLNGFEAFPQGSKAPDTLLKLGRSLEQLDKKTEACATYSKLLTSFTTLSPSIKEYALKSQRDVPCTR